MTVVTPDGATISGEELVLSSNGDYFHVTGRVSIRENGRRLIGAESDAYVKIMDDGTWSKSPGRWATADLAPGNESEDAVVMSDDRSGVIGFATKLGSENTEVYGVVAGSPADRAGLSAGDQLLQIDDVDLRAIAHSDVLRLGRGRPGTKVRIVFRKKGTEDIQEVEIIRVDINELMSSSREP